MSLWFVTAAATALIAGAPGPPAAFVAPCPSGISGGLPPGYERSSLLIGPLALYAAAEYGRYPARFITHVPGDDRRYPGLEAAATVHRGGTVTLAIAREDRAHAGFLFDHRAFESPEPVRRRVAFGTGACA